MEQKLTITEGKNRQKITLTKARYVEVFNMQGKTVWKMTSERISAPQIIYLEAGDYTVVSDGKIDAVNFEKVDAAKVAEPTQRAILSLRSDAKDFHLVDGIGEIPADGKSFTTITIQKFEVFGKPLESDADNDEIYLRTNAGIIKDVAGDKEIRSVKLKKDQGAFRLYSEERKRVATVEAITAIPLFTPASIKIEFY